MCEGVDASPIGRNTQDHVRRLDQMYELPLRDSRDPVIRLAGSTLLGLRRGVLPPLCQAGHVHILDAAHAEAGRDEPVASDLTFLIVAEAAHGLLDRAHFDFAEAELPVPSGPDGPLSHAKYR